MTLKKVTKKRLKTEEITPKEYAMRSNTKSNNVNFLPAISLTDISGFISDSRDDRST